IDELSQEVTHVADLAVAERCSHLIAHLLLGLVGRHAFDQTKARTQEPREDSVAGVTGGTFALIASPSSASAIHARNSERARPDLTHELVDQPALARTVLANEGDGSGLRSGEHRLVSRVQFR